MTKEENQDTQKISTPQNEEHEKESFENLETSLDDSKDKNIDQDNLPKQTPEEKIIELEDKLARTFAEMENQRRRFEKEKDDAYEYGGFAFAKEALNLIDNLERSKQILENDETLKNSEALKKTIEHLNIIEKDLISIFSKNDIKPIECLNKKLDPHLHQAMIEIEDDQKEPGTIVQVIQKGFTIKQRLLRPALVGVSKKLTQTKKTEENKEFLGEN